MCSYGFYSLSLLSSSSSYARCRLCGFSFGSRAAKRVLVDLARPKGPRSYDDVLSFSGKQRGQADSHRAVRILSFKSSPVMSNVTSATREDGARSQGNVEEEEFETPVMTSGLGGVVAEATGQTDPTE